MKQLVSKTIIFLIVSSTVFGVSRFFEILGQTQALAYSVMIDPKIQARAVVENYTGENYSAGDCEALELYESADEAIDLACSILEGSL